MKIEVGKEYIINHSRKGTFIGKIVKDDGEWLTVEITKGKAHYISVVNNLDRRGNIGDIITIRKSFCTFEKVN